MGGSSSLIATVFSSVLGSVTGRARDDSAREERRAREKARLRDEAEERRKERERVKEARALEKKRSGTDPTRSAVSLADDPEVSGATLKSKLGE